MIRKTNLQGVETYYYHNQIEDKHFFGGFFNLASNNITQILQEFSSRLHLTKYRLETLDQINIQKNLINEYFSDEVSYSDWDRRIKVLTEYLPIIHFLDIDEKAKDSKGEDRFKNISEKRKFFRENFISLLDAIDKLRNFYTHHYHSDVKIEENVFVFLDKVLGSVVLDIKKKKLKNDDTRELLSDGLVEELKILKDLKVKELNKIKKSTDKISVENAVFNDAIRHLVNDSGKSIIVNDSAKAFNSDDSDDSIIQISSSGLVFLLSMFLSKKEIELLKSRTQGFKGKMLPEGKEISKKWNSLRFMVTQWTYSNLCFKGLKYRVKTIDAKLSLLTQMIDELSKVPDSVYKVAKDKKEFRYDMREFGQLMEGNVKSLNELTVINPVKRKRFEDKFNYFALRFLDEFADFPTLRFQIYAGQYVHQTKKKELTTIHFKTERIIKERINVFGKLTDVANYKSDYFDENTDTNWELFPNPSYNLVGNNIHIYLKIKNQKIKGEIENYRKELNTDERNNNKLTKERIISEIYSDSDKVQAEQPVALLSLNELQALLYEFFKGKTGKELEDIIYKNIANRYEKIKDYKKGDDTKQLHLSRRLAKSEVDSEIVDLKKINRAIDKEIEITNEKIKLIKTNEQEIKIKNSKRKYIFYSKELGEEATWITNDLVRFMPQEAKEKWKAYYHSELQRLIALYDKHRNDARKLLLIDWERFDFNNIYEKDLFYAFGKNKFHQFYREYLKTRNRKLRELKANLEKKTKLNELFQIFDKRLYVISTTKQKKKELLTKPLVLARGIFDSKGTYVRGKDIRTNPELFAEWYGYCVNTSHDYQKYYSEKFIERDYAEAFDFWAKGRTAELNEKNFDKDEKKAFFERKQNAEVRRVKYKDLFVNQMVNYIFETEYRLDEKVSLADMFLTKEEISESQKIAMQQKDREKEDKTPNKYMQASVWDKMIRKSIYDGKLIEESIKLKDIGKLNKLERDPRVKSIINYDETKVWTKLEMENELENTADSYEPIRRKEMLRLIQNFEKFILAHHKYGGKHPSEFESNGNPNFRKYIEVGVLAKIKTNTIDDIENKKKILIEIRNKFAHNQLPEQASYKIMNTWLEKKGEETYSRYFYRIAKLIIDEFERELKKQ